MEIRRILRKGGRLGDFVSRPVQADRSRKQTRSVDRLELLHWMADLEEQRFRRELETYRQAAGGRRAEERSGLWALLEQAQKKPSEDALFKAIDAQEKCSKIAAQIMNGRKVPQQDKAFLMNNDPEGYLMAVLMRRPQESDEVCKSVLSEEDRRKNDGGVTVTLSHSDAAAPGHGPGAAAV